jgi:phosphoserine phosphatase RsbU/P
MTCAINWILIVDDDSSVRASLRKVLEQAGYAVRLASQVQEALTALEAHSFSLVLLDLNLPQQNGWEVLERVSRRSPALPMVIVTGVPDQRWAREIASLAPVLEKPLDAAVLLSTIQQLLEEPREVRLRRFCAYLESRNSLAADGATYRERAPSSVEASGDESLLAFPALRSSK